MALIARDVMNSDVVSARESMTIQQLILLLKSNRITGVPVLDEAGSLVGVVSESDIVLRDEAFGDAPVMESDFHTHSHEEPGDLEALDLQVHGDTPVRDIMSKSAITADADTPVERLAGIMHTNRIHRVVIVEAGALVGIVSTMDLLKVIMEGKVL